MRINWICAFGKGEWCFGVVVWSWDMRAGSVYFVTTGGPEIESRTSML